MIRGTTVPVSLHLVGKSALCTVRVPWENGSTAPRTDPFPAFNTLYVLQQGFFK
jgi:hypothetical protein